MTLPLGLLADIVGVLGSALIVAAYAYVNVAKSVNRLLYNLVNLFGALFLTISLLVHFNLASFLLELVWIAIALFGIARALRARREES